MLKLYYPKKNMALQYIFIDLYKIFKINTWRMIFCNLLKFSSFLIFITQTFAEFSLTSFGTLKYDCVIKTTEMFNFLPLINSSVTTGLIILLLIISAIISLKNINIYIFFKIVFFNIFINILYISFECLIKALRSS